VPAVLYAYRNTVHSATGFTPHYLMFGWEPTDLRVPLSAFPHPSSHPDIGAFLGRRAEEFKLAQRNIEHARQAMISARKASANAHTYAENDLVKVSTRVLRPKPVSTQVPKLQPSWVGPFKVLESIGPNAYRLQLPHEYRLVHDVFNAVDLRPWLQHEAHALEPGYPQPAVFPHPSLNPIVQVLDRSRLPGRVRTVDDPLDIPCRYLVLRRSGDTEWLRSSASVLEEPVVAALVRDFELRFPRSSRLPCNSVANYPRDIVDDDYESPDEFPLLLHRRLHARGMRPAAV
jgi:hypothetical protein